MTTQTFLDTVRSIHARAAEKWRRSGLAQRPVARGFVDSACQARRLLVLATSCALLIASPAWSAIILSNDTTSLTVNGGEANNGLVPYDGYFRYTDLATSEEMTWSVDPVLVFSDGSTAVLSNGLAGGFGSPVDIGGGIVRSTAMTNGVIVQADTQLIGPIARTTFNFTGPLDNTTFIFYAENDIFGFTDDVALFAGSIAGGDLELAQFDTSDGGLSVLLAGEAGPGATLSLFGSGIFTAFGEALESGDLSVLSSDGSNFVGGPGDLGLALAFSLAGSEATVIVDYLVVPSATIYVDDDTCPDEGSGTEMDPYCSIQTAIDSAMDLDEIVVAPGTYFETIDFLGKAIWLHSSDGPKVTTIDGTGFFHVVQCVSGEGPDTMLEGFTITGGNANGNFRDNFGGGMYNQDSNPTVTDCTFSENAALGGVGGGMYNDDSSPVVTNCTFSGNEANFGGGMANLFQSSPPVTNCTFSGNSAEIDGGGMLNVTLSSPTVANCSFEGNNAAEVGGGMYNFQSSPVVINCTFGENTAFEEGGGLYNADTSNAVVANCTLWGDSPDEIAVVFPAVAKVSYSNVQGGWVGGNGNIDADPLFVDPGNGDFRLSSGSPCIDAGDNTAVPKGIDTDLDGNPRFVDDPDTPDTGNGDPPIVDMGAFEFHLPCPWDLDGDGLVATADLLMLLGAWGSDPGGPPDFNGDGNVGTSDLLELLSAWGPCK